MEYGIGRLWLMATLTLAAQGLGCTMIFDPSASPRDARPPGDLDASDVDAAPGDIDAPPGNRGMPRLAMAATQSGCFDNSCFNVGFWHSCMAEDVAGVPGCRVERCQVDLPDGDPHAGMLTILDGDETAIPEYFDGSYTRWSIGSLSWEVGESIVFSATGGTHVTTGFAESVDGPPDLIGVVGWPDPPTEEDPPEQIPIDEPFTFSWESLTEAKVVARLLGQWTTGQQTRKRAELVCEFDGNAGDNEGEILPEALNLIAVDECRANSGCVFFAGLSAEDTYSDIREFSYQGLEEFELRLLAAGAGEFVLVDFR